MSTTILKDGDVRTGSTFPITPYSDPEVGTFKEKGFTLIECPDTFFYRRTMVLPYDCTSVTGVF